MRNIFNNAEKLLWTLLFLCGTSQLGAQQIITVTDCNLDKWQKQVTAGNSLSFVTGVATPPGGQGSLMFISPNRDYVRFRNTGFHKTLLSSLTSLRYSTYVQNRDNNVDINYVVLQIDLDNDEITNFNLVFDPHYQTGNYILQENLPDQGPALMHQWQEWDMLHGGWWLSTNPPDANDHVQLISLSSFISQYPQARINNNKLPPIGGIRITAGSPQAFSPNFIGYCDLFTIGVNGVTTIYDFEFSTITTANAGPDKTVIYGYGSNCIMLNGTASGGMPPYTYSWTPGGSTPTAASTQVCPVTTTTYTLTVSDSYGCTRSDQATVFVNDVRCGNNLDKVSICHNGGDICIAAGAVQAHLDHGDGLGTCPVSAFMTAEKKTEKIIPGRFKTFHYPNPAIASTTIEVELPVDGLVSIRVYNASGMEMTTVVNEKKLAGIHRFALHLEKYTPGMYYYTINVQTGNGILTEMKKLMKL